MLSVTLKLYYNQLTKLPTHLNWVGDTVILIWEESREVGGEEVRECNGSGKLSATIDILEVGSRVK